MGQVIESPKRFRRMQMLSMHRAGATAGEIARHFRYTKRHTQREMAEARRTEGNNQDHARSET